MFDRHTISLSIRHGILFGVGVALFLLALPAWGTSPGLQERCGDCHTGEGAEGGFQLDSLGDFPNAKTIGLWVTCVDRITTGEMPPPDADELTEFEREKLLEVLRRIISAHDNGARKNIASVPRRLNNRELANSLRDALLIDHVGTHDPLGGLLGDTLHEGFDTHAESLAISEYHLERLVEAVRRVVDATILDGPRPPTKTLHITADRMAIKSLGQGRRRDRRASTPEYIDFADPRLHLYFDDFKTVPTSGHYEIRVVATGKDRNVYPSEMTAIWDNDPIQMDLHLGSRIDTFELPDEEPGTFGVDAWLGAGTRVELHFPTDGLRLRSNGNFKFQYAIAHDHLKKHDPETYRHVIKNVVPKSRSRNSNPGHWSHWVDHWQGPRPRVYSATIRGPIFQQWPPSRTTRLIGRQPSIEGAANILRPIAERAWGRRPRDGELDPIIDLVQRSQADLGDVGALKEGIVAIFTTPAFWLTHRDEGTRADRFATKLSHFLDSTLPSDRLRQQVRDGDLDSLTGVQSMLRTKLADPTQSVFCDVFPASWLQLDRINFMAPDPDQFPLFSRKDYSADMIDEVKAFFHHLVRENRPITECLTANYSFVNADLATVYGLDAFEPDSKLRRVTFEDGRRGGLLGMGAFLTLTADSLGTSPIHRAVYVMENFLGIEPTPPPPDVKIQEPDVRSAKTIKEVLAAHASDDNCASCHRGIDPYGYAFENFNPIGAWRDRYGDPDSKAAGSPIDASSVFRNGNTYNNIIEYRALMASKENQERFMRCFVKKCLLYANGIEPNDFTEIERIVVAAKEDNYRFIETLARVIDSPLFRGRD
ncbi:MAG: DUF1588 domain-containing protein [Planctomycetota bacterium]